VRSCGRCWTAPWHRCRWRTICLNNVMTDLSADEADHERHVGWIVTRSNC
jgi:hypothetical protein